MNNEQTNNISTNTTISTGAIPTTLELLQKVNQVYLENEITYLKDENRKIDEVLREMHPTTDIEVKTFNILTQVKADNEVKIGNLVQQLVLTNQEVL